MLLAVDGLDTAYGPIVVNRAASLTVGDGEIVAMLGPNGAGKTTLAAGDLGPPAAQARDHPPRWRGGHRPPADRGQPGVVMVPEGRRIFAGMTVRENLRLGAYCAHATATRSRPTSRRDGVLFRRSSRRSATPRGAQLSGGQQQMLAIARGLMARPRSCCWMSPRWGFRRLSSGVLRDHPRGPRR